jgi:hypothetical protein
MKISEDCTWGIQVASMSNSRQITRIREHNDIIENTHKF